MSFKLVIADIVDVPLNFSVNDAGKNVTFIFALQAIRVSQDTLRDLVEKDANQSVAEFLAEHVTGWRNQRLVVGDDGQPVEFSRDAFACMLNLVGMTGLILTAYIEACGPKGKAKN